MSKKSKETFLTSRGVAQRHAGNVDIRVALIYCRGGACPSRRNAADTNRLPLKWVEPIAPVAALTIFRAPSPNAHTNVAALTAQPLAALPPYGCGVPFTGGERHGGWQYLRHKFRGVKLPDLSLRGGRRPTWRPEREARGSALGVQSREGSYDFADGSPVIQSGTARLPRAQSALAMTHQEVQWCASALLRLDGPVQAVRGVPGGASPSRTILHQRVVSTVISPETIFFDSSSTAFFTSSGTCCAAPSSP